MHTDLNVPLREVSNTGRVVDMDVVIVTADHHDVLVDWDIRLGDIVVLVVAVRGAKPLVEAVVKGQVLRSVSQVPVIHSANDSIAHQSL